MSWAYGLGEGFYGSGVMATVIRDKAFTIRSCSWALKGLEVRVYGVDSTFVACSSQQP